MSRFVTPTSTAPHTWEFADLISDKIVDFLNAEIANPDFSATQMFAGQMLAMLAMLRTAPAGMPAEMVTVREAVSACLASIFNLDIET